MSARIAASLSPSRRSTASKASRLNCPSAPKKAGILTSSLSTSRLPARRPCSRAHSDSAARCTSCSITSSAAPLAISACIVSVGSVCLRRSSSFCIAVWNSAALMLVSPTTATLLSPATPPKVGLFEVMSMLAKANAISTTKPSVMPRPSLDLKKRRKKWSIGYNLWEKRPGHIAAAARPQQWGAPFPPRLNGALTSARPGISAPQPRLLTRHP